MILDATDLIVGRFATVAAKKAMLGEKIDVVNCEKAIMTGSKKEVLARIKRKRKQGVPLQGPYFPRSSDRMVRRIIRGMLPYKQKKGEAAFKNIMCYIGVPTEFKDKQTTTVEAANVSKMDNVKFVTIRQITQELGAK